MTENRRQKQQRNWESESERVGKSQIQKLRQLRSHCGYGHCGWCCFNGKFLNLKANKWIYICHSSLLLSIWWQIESALKFHLYYKVLQIQKVIYRLSIWERDSEWKRISFQCIMIVSRKKRRGDGILFKGNQMGFYARQFTFTPRATICTMVARILWVLMKIHWNKHLEMLWIYCYVISY